MPNCRPLVTDTPQRGPILIVAPSAIGDVILAQPLLAILRQQYPQRPLDVLARTWCLPVTKFMPDIRHRIPSHTRHGQLGWKHHRQEGRQLRDRGYTQAFVLPASFKSALIPFFARIPVRTGRLGELRFPLINDLRAMPAYHRHPLSRMYAALAYPSGQLPERLPEPTLQVPTGAADPIIRKLRLDTSRPLLAICPGASDNAETAKKWPLRYYTEVAQAWIGAGGIGWLFGSARERPLTQQLWSALEPRHRRHCQDLSGRSSLAESIALLDRCDHVISNDSGLMHAAAALKKSQTALFGPTSEAEHSPQNHRARLLSLNLPCSPCHKDRCPLKHHACMESLKPQWVIDQLPLPQ